MGWAERDADRVEDEQSELEDLRHENETLRGSVTDLFDGAVRFKSMVVRVKELHHRYLPPAVDFDCCAECNRVSSSYVPYPCSTINALEGK